MEVKLKSSTVVGRSIDELQEVVLDVEVALNNRPLNYLEDDIELPVLTPNSMINITSTQLPELNAHHINEKNLRKRAKFLKKCKQHMWKRWSREYVRRLRERHVNAGGKQASCPRKGSAVIIEGETKLETPGRLVLSLNSSKEKMEWYEEHKGRHLEGI